MVVTQLDAQEFMKIYTSLPLSERQLTIIVIRDEPFSWNRAYTEIKANTQIGGEILKRLSELNII